MDTMKRRSLLAVVFFLAGTCCYANPIDDINNEYQVEERKTWIQNHIWVPIVAAIVFLILVIALCTCCCCCGCCACCRSRQPNVIVQSGHPSTNVTMASTTNMVQTNPMHVGYSQ